MRLSACHGIVLLALLAACETVPDDVKIDVGGRTLEIKKKPPAAEEPRDEPREEPREEPRDGPRDGPR
jgi:hypothetical protein